MNHQMKAENQKLRWNITYDNDGFSQLTLAWRTPSVNMSVTHSAYKKKPPSEKHKESYIEMMSNSSAAARNVMETLEKVTLSDSFESSPLLDCSLIQSLKVNTRSNASRVWTSPMIESLHKQNKEKPCATGVTSSSQ